MDKKNELYEEALLKSTEIDEIIGQPPHWLIRWGITVFFAILILVLTLSYFIEYPETITTPFILNADHPAIPLRIQKSGQLIHFFKKAGEQVVKNDTLLFWRENNATEKHILLSPADGRIEFISPLNNGEILSKGQLLLFIVPKAGVYFASVYVNAALIRKIKVGQHVVLNLQEYPRQEFGYINGVIDYKSNVNNTKGYYVRIALTNGLRSDLGKTLPIRDSLNGTADIVITKQKLLYKFMGKYKF